MDMRKALTLPPRYLFKLGIEPWKPNAVKNTGLAEMISALSMGIAIKLSSLISGNIKLNTITNVAIITKNNTRLILSTLCVPIMINAPKKRVKINTATLPEVSRSTMVGSVSVNKEPPPLM